MSMSVRLGVIIANKHVSIILGHLTVRVELDIDLQMMGRVAVVSIEYQYLSYQHSTEHLQ